MDLRVFTAFSGYDSQCMALDRLHEHHPEFTYDLIGWAEIDPYAIKAHDAIYPQWAQRNYGDISKIDWQTVPDFDLFTYSSPCQDFSQAGNQKGGEKGSGTRSSLLWECERAIIAKRPKYLLMENVAALVSSKFIRLFHKWQLTLEGYGYRNFAKVLNAKDYGVPQNRERIFMVSILDEAARYEFPKPFPLKLRLKDVLENKVDEMYYLSDDKIKANIDHCNTKQEEGCGFKFEPTDGNCVGKSITTKSGSRETDNYIKEPIVLGWSRSTDADGKEVISRHPVKVANCVTSGKRENTQNYVVEPQVLTPKRTEYGKQIRKQYEAGEVSEQRKNMTELEPRRDGICNTLTSVQKDNMVCIPTNTKDGVQMMELGGVCDLSYPSSTTRRGRVQEGGTVSPTLTCGCENHLRRIEAVNTDADGNARAIRSSYFKAANANFQPREDGFVQTAVKECDYRIRKLTERECFRLMDVPERYIDRIQGGGISRTQQYRMAGNSICVACLYYIFDKLFVNTKITELTLF